MYVHMLQSLAYPQRYSVGMTEDLPERLKIHNTRNLPHPAKFAPWRVETAVAFRDRTKAPPLNAI